MAPAFNREDILRTWHVFRQPGEVLELRIPKAGRYKTISGYFNDPGALADAAVGLADEGFAGIYFTINPVKPDLLARAANRYVKYAETTTSDNDIAALHWLPIDLDAKRPAGISSTDEEHEAAITKARDVRQKLVEFGWPVNAFVLADSGNGAHLNARIELANTTENIALITRCLEALDFLFSDETIHVDVTSKNPARIWKLYGTMARKGDSTADRPHRMSKLLEVPETLETVTREQLEALAAMLPEPEKTSQPSQSIGGPGFDVVAYCQAHDLPVHHTKTWTDPSGTKCVVAVLERCIFNPEHHLSAVIIGWPNGARSYRCRHNSCLSKRWKDAKAIIEPGADSFDGIPTMPPLTRVRANAIEAATGVHIFNAADDPSQNEISEEELNAYSLPAGPKFECNLPKDHFIQRFMAYGSDISDAYIEYWFAAGLFALAVIADKKMKVELKQGTIYPNLYISINGKSSLARKSTVVDKAEAMLCQVKPSLLPAMVPTEFSPEAFTEHLSEFNHASWIRDEAAGVLGLMKKDYMRGFKDSLMQLYDSRPFYRKLRTSQRKGTKTEFRVDDPYLNLLWATTDASLGANTEQNDTLSGFMARFLFFFPQGAKDKWLPLEEGTAANSIFESVVRDQLAEIAAQLQELHECQAMHFSPEATRYYTEWQRVREQEWTASNDGNAMQLYSRLAPTVIKLAMLFELGMPGFDPSRPIRGEFIEEACRLVDSYFMPTAIAVYELVGANAEKNRLDKIVAYLKKHNGKAQKRDVLRATRLTKSEFDEAVDTMIESGEIEERPDDPQGKGRPRIWILLNSVNNVITVNKVINVNKVNRDKSRFSREGEFCDNSDKNDKMDKIDKKDNWSDSEDEKPKSGFQRFKSGMKKRICCLCGRSFAYDLTPYFNKGQSGYICATCHMEGPPSEPEKVDSQTKLEAGA